MTIYKIKNQGFGLIEVLVAFALVMVGVVGLIKVQAYLDRKNDFAYKSMIALRQAENKLEYFHQRGGAISFESISSGTETVLADNVEYTLTYVVTPALEKPEPVPKPPLYVPVFTVKNIEIESSWIDRFNQKQSVKLETAISRYSEFD